MGFAFLSGFYACAVDWDHIWEWVLHTPTPWILPSVLFGLSSAGRPFHTVYFFVLYSVVLGGICTAFVVRRLESCALVEAIEK